MNEHALRCPNCGLREDEREEYHPEGYRCLACEKIEIEKENWQDPSQARGVTIRLYKGPPVLAPRPPKE